MVHAREMFVENRKMMNFLIILMGSFCVTPTLSLQFDKSRVGVAFSPYVDGRGRNQYTLRDIMQQLVIVGKYFGHITTYGVGVNGKNMQNKNWAQGESEVLVARAAATLNRAAKKKLFSVNIGVYQRLPAVEVQNREIEVAYLAAADANAIFPNTVWGITFTNEYITNEATTRAVRRMIQTGRRLSSRLKVGFRSHKCGVFSDNPGAGGWMKEFQQLVRESDFIYCNQYASAADAKGGAKDGATRLTGFVDGYRKRFSNVNKNIDFRVGETGWPSEGDFLGYATSPNNLIDYWLAINEWAKRTKVQTQMFEAFDEPRKPGPNGEKKFGLWYKNDKGYFEKVKK